MKPTSPATAGTISSDSSYTGPDRSDLSIDLRLDSNEGPALQQSVVDWSMLAETAPERLRSYPSADVVTKQLAELYSVSPDRIVLTAGADEALDRIFRSLTGPGRSVVLPVPTFTMMEHYARAARAEVSRVDWCSGPYPTEAVLAAVTPSTALVVVVSPNNPTGAIASPQDLQRISASLPPGCLALLDAAYDEFADVPLGDIARDLHNVITTRTLSKAWGLAGCRIGCAITPPPPGTALREVLEEDASPYSIAGPSLAIAEQRLKTGREGMKASVSRIRREVRTLETQLRSCGIDVESSAANFVYARGERAIRIGQLLRGLGIGVRRFADAIRITCPGDDIQFSRLTESLQVVLQPEAILFDMDGVLVDVGSSYRRAIQQTAAAFGVAIDTADIQERKRLGDANDDWVVTFDLIQTALRAAGREDEAPTLESVTERFEALYQGTTEAPGLWTQERALVSRSELEQYLKPRGLRCGVVTGRPRRDAEAFLAREGLLDTFEVVVCREDGALKPSPEPLLVALREMGIERAWYLGDTVDDVRTARAAGGVLPIGVLAPSDGETQQDALEAAGAATVVDRWSGLGEWIA